MTKSKKPATPLADDALDSVQGGAFVMQVVAIQGNRGATAQTPHVGGVQVALADATVR